MNTHFPSHHNSTMRNEILASINEPKQLETLYRGNKAAFKQAFSVVYPEIANNPIAACWKERLDHERSGISWGSSSELAFVIIASLLAGTIAKVPEFLPVDEDFFYPRNIGFVVFPLLMAYFAWKNTLKPLTIVILTVATAVAFIFINALPEGPRSEPDSHTLILACIHLPLFLWSLLGFTYVGGIGVPVPRRIDFLRYFGDLVIVNTLILIAGALLTGLTIALFSVIDFDIAEFYLQYVVVYGLAASPIVATYVVQRNPDLVKAVSPMIAKIFSPLVLITLTVYLMAMIGSGKNPFMDRDFLITFNGLLIGVMAIILFSVAGSARATQNRIGSVILLLLAVLTILVNSVALMAILFRINEWGITPNRFAVLGGNVLMLVNLLLVTYRLVHAAFRNTSLEPVELAIARYLPIYTCWTAIVVFAFPFLFGFE